MLLKFTYFYVYFIVLTAVVKFSYMAHFHNYNDEHFLLEKNLLYSMSTPQRACRDWPNLDRMLAHQS